MAKFYDVNPAAGRPVAELDEAALRHGGILCSVGYGFGCPEHTDTVYGGWRLRWIDRRGMGNHGTAVLIPTDARTRALYRDGQMCSFRAAGVPERYLPRLVCCRIGRKHELIATIARVLSDTAQVRAVRDFGNCGGGQGSGGERACWSRKWSPLVDDISLSEPRMCSLADVIRDVTSADCPDWALTG
jgi:hypothetical protein